MIDLTDPPNVELFRSWDMKEAAYIQQLRFIRISSDSPNTVIVTRAGKHPSLKKEEPITSQETSASVDMELDDVPLLIEPPSRFASSMMTMDGPLP